MDTRIEDLENKLGIKPEERESLDIPSSNFALRRVIFVVLIGLLLFVCVYRFACFSLLFLGKMAY